MPDGRHAALDTPQGFLEHRPGPLWGKEPGQHHGGDADNQAANQECQHIYQTEYYGIAHKVKESPAQKGGTTYHDR